MTAADSQNQNPTFYNMYHLPSGAALIDPSAEPYSGMIYYFVDANGQAYYLGTETSSETLPAEPEEPTEPPISETDPLPEDTLPAETTEDVRIPETLPEETTEPVTETETEETTELPSETLPESEEETTEESSSETETSESQEATTETTRSQPKTEPAVPETTRSGERTWTWVDVDLTNQRVTVYQGDTAIGSFPCVTGCVADDFATPTGTFYIRYKARNRMLGGNSFVKYWMPFYKDYGLHDASWRNGNFRSDHAWYYGSHGCVNMPEEGAKFIWDNCSAGDTVIVHGWPVNPGKHTGHELTGPWVVEKEATCTEDGLKVKYCPYCYAVASERKIPAAGHSGEWKIVKEATATSEGLKERVCTVCGETEQVVIPMLGTEHTHSWTVLSETEVTEEDEHYIYVYQVTRYNNCSCGEAKAEEKKLISKTEKETEPPTTEAETTPEETTVAETTPEETTVVETTPEETTVVETTPEETTVAETTPEETTVVETTPEETTAAETLPDPAETGENN